MKMSLPGLTTDPVTGLQAVVLSYKVRRDLVLLHAGAR